MAVAVAELATTLNINGYNYPVGNPFEMTHDFALLNKDLPVVAQPLDANGEPLQVDSVEHLVPPAAEDQEGWAKFFMKMKEASSNKIKVDAPMMVGRIGSLVVAPVTKQVKFVDPVTKQVKDWPVPIESPGYFTVEPLRELSSSRYTPDRTFPLGGKTLVRRVLRNPRA